MTEVPYGNQVERTKRNFAGSNGRKTHCGGSPECTSRSGLRSCCAKERNRKRIVVLRCGTVLLQNFSEDLNEPGRQLKLVREPDNAYDRWATRVVTLEGTMLGYLPARKNQSVARLIDAGKTITVFVDESLQAPARNPNYESEKLPLILYMDVNIPEEEQR